MCSLWFWNQGQIPQNIVIFAVFSHSLFDCLFSHKSISLNRLSPTSWHISLQCVGILCKNKNCGLCWKIILHMLLLMNCLVCLVTEKHFGSIRQVFWYCKHSSFLQSTLCHFQFFSIPNKTLIFICLILTDLMSQVEPDRKFFLSQNCRMKICHALTVQKLFPFVF